MKNYWKWLKPYLLFFLGLQFILRLSLLGRGLLDVEIGGTNILHILSIGFWFDIVTAGFVVLPIIVLHTLLPSSVWHTHAGRWLNKAIWFVFTFLLCFDFVAEHLFWSEFTTRFNFIAVDYLVYTQEVIGNIAESYPLGWVLSVIALVAAAITWQMTRRRNATILLAAHIKPRLAYFIAYGFLCFALHSLSDVAQAESVNNAEGGEIAANGIYNLFHAFWHNEINYERFYTENTKKDVQKRARDLFEEEANYFESADGTTRIVNPSGPEKHKNVIIVVMESMSAEYMQAFGNHDGLTPNLDALAKKGLFFTQTYATGTRTVRGLEAVTLSVPPTPGQSIVRRPGNENLFSLGFVFKDRGYDTKFLYGGYGYFDNMNNFFAGNGFDIVDRTNLAEDEIHFSNVWGVPDDDIFARAIKEADASFAAHKPFMHLIMTTSNHRPYTYPDGKIDIPSKSGRSGGVKYADYSVGKLIAWAEKKPWFKNTVFIFVADHTAGAGGKAELDPKKYHIPLIFYSPDLIKQGRYERIISQIDVAPILLGQLNFHYRTKFYGEDILHDDDEIPHAFISNYQKVALVKEGIITVLAPKRSSMQLNWPEQAYKTSDSSLLDETVAYYQSASWWRDTYRRVPTTLKE
jgi:phosphoglycerol transferase MdoB-like AlkP superfamily enzyme